MSIVKHFVSKKKRRFQQNGYDLDLTYITDNIVAMGYPYDKLEGMFRNKADDVIRFFDHFHNDSYKVYNLCSEKKYDPSKFHNRVAEYPFEDYNAPRFEMLKPCCEDIQDWLRENSERNVVAIHCKAGTGRTGVIICSYLLHINEFSETKDALQFYGERRTQNAKGVTIPSQRRYVYYYSYLLRQRLTYSPTPLLLKSITLVGVPTYSGGVCAPMFIVRQGQGAKIYQSEPVLDVKKTDREIKIILPKPLPICGDMRIEFVHVGKINNKKEKMFQYWFNTFFIYHACPTEEQEVLVAQVAVSVPPSIPEHPEKEGSRSAKKVAPPPNIPEQRGEEWSRSAKKVAPPPNVAEHRGEEGNRSAKKVAPPPNVPEQRGEEWSRSAKKVAPPPNIPEQRGEEWSRSAKKVPPPPNIPEQRGEEGSRSAKKVAPPPNVAEHRGEEGNRSAKKVAPPPNVPEQRGEEWSRPAKKFAPPATANVAESVASLPIQKSSSSNSLADGIEMRASPERVPVGVGLTKRKRVSVRRSISDFPSDGIHPMYCEEFNLNLPKWELDRAHKDKECKLYPDSFRVITSMSNSPKTQSPEEIGMGIDSAVPNKRDELVETDTDLSEDDDDDDVSDPTEIMKKQTDRKIRGRFHQKHAKGSTSQIDFSKMENVPATQRTHSNAITSLSPTLQTPPFSNQFQPSTDQSQPPINQSQPPNNQSQPPINQSQPPINQSQPPNSQSQPPISQSQPPNNQSQPPNSQSQLPNSQSQPQNNQSQPPNNQSQPPNNQSQPPINQSQPPINQSQPSINQSQPPINQSQPPNSQSQPPISQSQPQISQSQPQISQSQPQIGQSQPPAYPKSLPNYQTIPSNPTAARHKPSFLFVSPKSEALYSSRSPPAAKGAKEVSL